MNKRYLVVCGTATLLLSAALGTHSGPSSRSVDQLQAAVDSLKADSKYDEALSAAGELLKVCESEEDVKRYVVEDARRLVRTLLYICALAPAAQAELAEAYRMGDEYERLFEEGAIDSAISVVRVQGNIFERHLGPDHPDVAAAKSDLGYLLQDRDELTAAEALVREALQTDLKTLGPEHPGVAGDLNNLAGITHAMGDLELADSLYRESLQIRLDVFGEYDDGVAMLYGNIAAVFMDKGHYAEAEPLYRKSLAIYQQLHGSTHQDVTNALHDLAALLLAKGDYAAAGPLLEEALRAYREQGSDLDLALTLNTAASSLQDEGDLAAAERCYQEALRIFRTSPGPHDDDAAAVLNNLADLRHDQGDYAGADSLYRQALTIRRSIHGKEDREDAIILLNIARNYRDWDRYADAEPVYADALKMFKTLLGNDHPYVALCLYSMTGLFDAQGQYEKSAPLLLDAVSAYEVSRHRVGSSLQRAMFQKSPYPKLANVYLRTGRIADAWPAVEMDLGRSLAELLIAADRRSLTPAEVVMEDSMKTEVEDLEQGLEVMIKAARSDTTGANAQRTEEIRNRLLAAQAAWSGFQQEMMNKYPLTEGASYSLERVQRAIPNGAIVVGWLDVEEKKGKFTCWVYAIRNRGEVVWAQVPSPPGTVPRSPFRLYGSFRSDLASPQPAVGGIKRDARAIWSERFAPLGDVLNDVERLVVIPSGAMLGVPVEALADETGTYLGDRYSVSYTPSATIYTWLKEREEKRKGAQGKESLLVGDPPFQPDQLAEMEKQENIRETCLAPRGPRGDRPMLRYVLAGDRDAQSSLDRLPCTRLEVEAITPLVPQPTLLVGPKASEQELVQLAEAGRFKDFQVIHLATHVLVDHERPERSALVLSLVNLPDPLEAVMKGERIYDGLVTAKEVLREWKLDADLVTLSACETALGKAVGGEGYVGLAHSFLQAGARSLIVSLWSVEDQATSLLMKRFYENWTGRYTDVRSARTGIPMSKADALQEAKRYVRTYTDASGERPFEHPYYWAAFMLMGQRE